MTPKALRLTVEHPHDVPLQRIKEAIDPQLAEIEKFLGWNCTQIETAERGLDAAVRAAIQNRRKRLLEQQGISDLLGIPLKKSVNAPQFLPIDTRRKVVRPLPPPPETGFKPEPGSSLRSTSTS